MAEYIFSGVIEDAEGGVSVNTSSRPQERIVRCRNCRFSDDGGRRCNNFLDTFDDEPALIMPDGFCAWGEER